MSDKSFTHLTDAEFVRHFTQAPRELPALEALTRMEKLFLENATLKDKIIEVQNWMEAQPDVSNT